MDLIDTALDFLLTPTAQYVINKSGVREPVQFDKITARNLKLCSKLPQLTFVNCDLITKELVKSFKNGMTTLELDIQTTFICTQLMTIHYEYAALAARLSISNHHRRTPDDVGAAYVGVGSKRYSAKFLARVEKYSAQINARINYDRDFMFKYFGWQTIERSYLECDNERPQQLYMRIALGIFEDNDEAFEFYDAISTHQISNASPTMLNAGMEPSQLASCFQMGAADDLHSLFQTVHDAAMISKRAGGISIHLHEMRAAGSRIASTNGTCKGIMQYIKVLNDTQIYVDQGGNRPGAFAMYLSVDHDDILDFIAMCRPRGANALAELNAVDLKYALWVSDLFMRTLTAEINGTGSGDWYLFNPQESPDLHLVYGKAYEDLYNRYVQNNQYTRVIKASAIIKEAFISWSQCGVPYVLYKDAINEKSNMKNVAPICSSNLCCEITIPSWNAYDVEKYKRFNPGNVSGEVGVCNLCAICLETFAHGDSFDFAAFERVVRIEVRALNKIIDTTTYPTEECKASNLRHRPIGIGIMGLADVFARYKMAYGSSPSLKLASEIMKSLYYTAVDESAELAIKYGPYASFEGSPMSQGILQPDMWGEIATEPKWEVLRAKVRTHGIRNAYLIAMMPTATTSNIVGQNESFEPYTSNIYIRYTLAGAFMMVNKYLVAELMDEKLWNGSVRQQILSSGGSIAGITAIPEHIRDRYLTVREMHVSNILLMAGVIAPFVCQSMSLNLFLNKPDLPKILRFLVTGWEMGLKTGMYYCHTRPATGAQKKCEVCVV